MMIDKRYTIYGISSAIAIILIFTILTVISFVTTQYTYQFDVTKTKKFTLSEQTIKILEGLQEPVKIYCFYEETTPKFADVKNLLKKYRYHSHKIEYEFIDPIVRLDLAEKYKINRLGTTIFHSGTRHEETSGTEETDFTGTLIKLITERVERKIYLIRGHDELDLESFNDRGLSKFREALEKQNYEVAQLSLTQQEQVPADAAVIIIAGPRIPFLEEELKKLQLYLENQGALLLLLDPPIQQDSRIPTFSELLEHYGVKLENNFIFDVQSYLFPDSGIPVIQKKESFGWHQITQDFNLQIILRGVRSIALSEPESPGMTVTELLKTTADSWGETNLTLTEPEFNEDSELKGPLTVAVAIEKSFPIQEGTTADTAGQGELTPKEVIPEQEQAHAAKEHQKTVRLVVVGDSDIASNIAFDLLGNSDFLLNSLSWLCQEEDLISIRPKPPEFQRMTLNNTQWRMIFIVIIGVPLAILSVGAMRWWKRRKR